MEERKEARKIIPCMLYRRQIRIPTQHRWKDSREAYRTHTDNLMLPTTQDVLYMSITQGPRYYTLSIRVSIHEPAETDLWDGRCKWQMTGQRPDRKKESTGWYRGLHGRIHERKYSFAVGLVDPWNKQCCGSGSESWSATAGFLCFWAPGSGSISQR
jgi:hypothetical protein